METGRKLDYLPKEDFTGGVLLSTEEPSVKEHKVVKKDKDAPEEKVTVTKEAHRILKVKSKTPKNKKKSAR